MTKQKVEDYTPPTDEEIAEIRNKYTKDTVFYTEPIEAALAQVE